MKRPSGFDADNQGSRQSKNNDRLTKKGSASESGRFRNFAAPISIFSKREVPAEHSDSANSANSANSADNADNANGANGADTFATGEVAKQSPKAAQKRLERRRRLVERAEMKRFTRDQRKRRIIGWTSVGVVVVFASALIIAVFSPLFAIRNVAVDGAQRLNVDDVKLALSEQFGTPLPLLDRSEVGEILAGFSLIESYSIESILPDTLQIRIVERTPIIMVKVGGKHELLDAAGITIEVSDKAFPDYPMLTTAQGTAVEDSFVPAIKVLRALPQELYTEVKSITATTNDDVTFELRDKKKTVLWGDSSQPELKAKLLSELLESVPKGKKYDVSSTSMPSVT